MKTDAKGETAAVRARLSHTGDESEQRSGRDRRRRAFPPLRFLVAGGRRREVRRSEDLHRIVILDRYSPKLFISIVGILLLSLLDGLLTLYLIEHGSAEINPVMDYFLKKGPLIFAIAKYVLTSLAVVIFVVVANSVLPRSNFRAQKLFPYALLAFGSVVVWEIMLVFVLAVRI
ncbi:MAG: DUF5658 family protein [Hyphomicrobiales bacterium]